jgi:hypothetical protein
LLRCGTCRAGRSSAVQCLCVSGAAPARHRAGARRRNLARSPGHTTAAPGAQRVGRAATKSFPKAV